MTEIVTSNLIKIIIIVFVIAIVTIGLYIFFKDTVLGFFKNIPGTEVFLYLIK